MGALEELQEAIKELRRASDKLASVFQLSPLPEPTIMEPQSHSQRKKEEGPRSEVHSKVATQPEAAVNDPDTVFEIVEEEDLLQLDVGVKKHPAEDAPQVFDESPEVSSVLGVQEEIGKDVQMENEKSPVQMPVEELVGELPPDQMSVPPVGRTLRCTGVIVSVASGLLGVCLPGTGARATALVGGLCAEWLGTIVSKDRSEAICTHMDFDKDTAPYFQRAVICDNPGAQLVNPGHIMDLFASALVQAEVAEMKVAVEILAAFKLTVVRLVFDPGGEFSAITAEFLKLEVKLLEGEALIHKWKMLDARELHELGITELAVSC